jgi:transposase-like protein
MKRNRRVHSAQFKSKVALEAMKEQKTMSQITSDYNLHANQISDWKKTLIEGSPSLFERVTSKEKITVFDSEAFASPYLEQIGMLQMEVNFLKKKLKQLGQT